MALAVDASVSALGTRLTGTVTSPSFSTVATNEVLFAFISNANLTGTGSISISTVTGAGLTWVKRVQNVLDAGTTVEIWSAFSASTLSSQTVVATSTDTTASSVFINVVTFTGADTTGTNGSGAVGATNATSHGTNGLPTGNVTTTRDASWVWGGGLDPQSNATITAGTNQTINAQGNDTVDLQRFWAQKQNATTPTSGTSVTINGTLGATDTWELAIIEILPALAATTTPRLRSLLGVGL